MKRISGILLVCMLLTGCGESHNATPASKPNNSSTNPTTVTTNNETVKTTSNSLPNLPAGFDWYEVTVNHKTYQYPAKSQQDVQHEGLLADTKYGVAWANPNNPKQILLSPPGTTVLDPTKAKVIYTLTLPSDKDKTVYDCVAEYFDVSPDAPNYLLWGKYVFKKNDRWVGPWDIHALNLKTGVDRTIVKNVRDRGGDQFSVAYDSHYFFYDQETPTASSTEAHVHMVDLDTGKDRLIWVGDSAKMPKLKVSLDGGTYTPVWEPYGTLFSFQ